MVITKLGKKIICIAMMLSVIISIMMFKQISFATESDENYVFTFGDRSIMSGGNQFAVALEDKQKISFDFYYINEQSAYNKVEIDLNNLEVISSDEKCAIITKESDGIYITGKSEGLVNITATYTYNGKEYTDTIKYTIFNDKEEVVGEYLVIDKSNIEISGYNSSEVSIFIHRDTFVEGQYPEGYDKNSYYIYEWKSSDETIATVSANNEDNSIANITAVSNGETVITCTIKTADNSKTIVKNVNVTVSGIVNRTICGDVNLDGLVNIRDAIFLNKAIIGAVELNDLAYANAQCDERTPGVDANDAMALLKFIVGLENRLPVTNKDIGIAML